MKTEDKILNYMIEMDRLHSMALGRVEDETKPFVVTFYGKDTPFFKQVEQKIKDRYFNN